jgi:ribosomal protein RSM22 (predicted rRNA methylase)
MRLGDGRPLKSVELFHGARKVELGDLFALRTEIKSFSDIRAVLPSPRAAASAAH